MIRSRFALVPASPTLFFLLDGNRNGGSPPSLPCLRVKRIRFGCRTGLGPNTFCSIQRSWRNGSQCPVWKRGPRSLTCMRVLGCFKPITRNESDTSWGRTRVNLIHATHYHPNRIHLWKVWGRAYLLGPERWWTIPDQSEARGNSGASSKRYWRANRSSALMRVKNPHAENPRFPELC